MSWIEGIFRDPGGGVNWPRVGAVIAAVAIAAWAVITFVVEHKDTPDKKDGTNITQSGQGNASGRDTNIGGNVNYGADGKQVGQAVAEATKPLIDAVTKLSAENAELVRRLE
jgi:hypothetical protein